MRYLLLLVMVGVLVGGPYRSLAQQEETAQKKYIGFAIGSSMVDADTSGADRVKDSDTTLKIFGGLMFKENAGAEFAYIDLGEASAHFPAFDETDVVEATALSAMAFGTIPLQEGFDLMGKIGLALWMVDASANGTVSGVPISGSGSGSGLDLTFGFGVKFDLSKTASLRLEFERYTNVGDGVAITFPGLGSVELDGSDVDVLSIGATFPF